MRRHLYDAGATDIPSDNTRLFDTWQDHGYAVSTPTGGAIWKVAINGVLTLTVLKFETMRLFHPSRRPTPFGGTLTVVVSDEADTKPSNFSDGGTNSSVQNFVGSPNKPQAPESCNNSQQTSPSSTKTPGGSSHTETYDLFGIETTPSGISNEGNTKTPTHETAHTPPATDIPESTKPNAAPKSFPLDDPDIPHYFLDWIRAGIRDGKIYTNRSNALIHIVKDGALIVSPLTFKKFIRSHPCLLESGKDENKITINIQNKLKKMMSLAGFHQQTKKGLNIHTYQINGANKTATVRGWLLPIAAVYGDLKPPGINSAMENISGFRSKH